MDATPLDPSLTYVTATKRLAHELRTRYDRQQLDAGKTAWESLEALSWEAWLRALWLRHPQSHRLRLLSHAQQQQLWEQIIRADVAKHAADTDPLWNFPATARQASQAWAIAQQWQIDLSAQYNAPHSDHRSFARWANDYQRQLNANRWLDSHGVITTCTQNPPPPNEHADPHTDPRTHSPIRWLGFDDPSPAQLGLMHALGAPPEVHAGSPKHAPENLTHSASLHCYETVADEWRAIAHWARDTLDARPDAQIGIVCADLAQQSDTITHALSEQLHPQDLSLTDTEQAPFHLSSGAPLARTPLVHSAFQLLALNAPCAYEVIAQALTAPFGFSDIPPAPRYAAEARLRKPLPYQADLPQLINALRALPSAPPELLTRCQQLNALRQDAPQRQTYSQWASYFDQWLRTAGWANTTASPAPNAPHTAATTLTLSSFEHQAMEAWHECLRDLGAFDGLSQPVTLDTALHELRQLAQASIFQPSTQHADSAAPVQVLGALETAGLRFDALWIASATDQHWPGKPKPSPFIPIAIQREAGVTEASVDARSAVIEARFWGLLAAHPDCQLSYALFDGTQPLAPSPLLAVALESAVAQAAPLPAEPPRSLSEHYTAQAVTLRLDNETHGRPLPERNIRSGNQFFEYQAACPFRAFATYRLQQGLDDPPSAGYNPLERGTIVHAILEQVFTRYPSSQALNQAVSEDTDDAVFSTFLRDTIKAQLKREHSGLGRGFQYAETERLTALITAWLALELERPYFHVSQREEVFSADVAGLTFSLRIDRIDRITPSNTTPHRYTVIDYKTGNTDPKEWAGERIEKPQLPLYTLTLEPDYPIDAVLYAQLREGDLAYKGIACAEQAFGAVKPPEEFRQNSNVYKNLHSWVAFKALWQERLERIAEEIKTGYAAVQTASAQPCTYCDYPLLCRNAQMAQEHEPDDPETALKSKLSGETE